MTINEFRDNIDLSKPMNLLIGAEGTGKSWVLKDIAHKERIYNFNPTFSIFGAIDEEFDWAKNKNGNPDFPFLKDVYHGGFYDAISLDDDFYIKNLHKNYHNTLSNDDLYFELFVYLKYFAEKGDIIAIENPERYGDKNHSNYLYSLLLKMMRFGIKLIISTSSNDFISFINRNIQQRFCILKYSEHTISDKQQNKIETKAIEKVETYSPYETYSVFQNATISKNEIDAYFFKKTNYNELIINVEKLEIEDYGIPITSAFFKPDIHLNKRTFIDDYYCIKQIYESKLNENKNA